MSEEPHYERRAFLILAAAGSTAYVVWARHTDPDHPKLPARVRIAEFDANDQPTGLVDVDTVRKTDAQWRKLLPSDSYSITRHADTEFAATGEYDKFYQDGIYRCICCGTALFDSKTKYASGTGWPSFTEPIARENIVEKPATSFFGMQETEVKCVRCDAHLGHVFDDGPPPLNLRYCINSGALRFIPRKSIS